MDIPLELLEQFERGNVLLFVGERVARDAQGHALVDVLTAQLVKRCTSQDSAYDADARWAFPEAAQLYEDALGRQSLIQFLREQFEQHVERSHPACHLIAELTDCSVLATTCLDHQLEQAFANVGRPLNVVIGNVDVAFEDTRKATLYKLRGTLDQPGSLVLTEDDYEAFFDDQASLSVVLQAHLATKTVLFVGYDLDDAHFKRLYRKVTASLDNYARRAYAFGEVPPPRVCRWCARHGIDVVKADAATFLHALTHHLAERRRPEPVPPSPPSAAVDVEPVALPERPYKLLDYYEPQDAAIFFGRQEETRQLTSLIHAHRLVLLYGASGTGKTSLLLAGAAPRLEATSYATIYVRALEDPAKAIRRAVERLIEKREWRRERKENGEERIANDELGIANDELAKQLSRLTHHASRLPSDASRPPSLVSFLHTATRILACSLVIFLDQFEEFFIRLSPEFREAFIAELGAVYDARDVPVKVVLSLREDWLASVGEIEQRIPGVFRTRMRLLPLTRAQAQEAITAPVARLGVRYAPALVTHLLDDLTRDGAVLPPQLQLVCSALYAGVPKGQGEREITLAAYESLGGARGVLQAYLDAELARLSQGEQALAHDLLEELVTSERTKAVKSGSELAHALGVETGALVSVLEKLVRARLLRVLDIAGAQGRAYELAHEYLIAEIALSPEAVARKEAEELLRQGVETYERFGAPLSQETFALIHAQRDRLRLDAAAQALMLRSALRYGQAVGEWLARMEDESQAVNLVVEVLLTPEGAAAAQNLGATAGNVPPQRLRVLISQLVEIWQDIKGTARACVADALWQVRAYVPRGVRLRVRLVRAPRALQRAALPLASVLVGALLIALLVWGPPLLTPKPDIDWVDVPAGTFMMGSDPDVDEVAYEDEMPQHKVALDAFRIGTYEVTNAEYAHCVKATVCDEPEGLQFYEDPAYADHPVFYVSWYDARDFCTWIGGRLPTEAEWEYAARGSDGRLYPWGNEPPTCDLAQFTNCDGRTKPVGSLPAGASPFGVLDMAGNVYEWVNDWYNSEYYEISPEHNPPGPDEGSSKVLRGGSFYINPYNLRAANRRNYGSDNRYNYVGFRCVVGAPGG